MASRFAGWPTALGGSGSGSVVLAMKNAALIAAASQLSGMDATGVISNALAAGIPEAHKRHIRYC